MEIIIITYPKAEELLLEELNFLISNYLNKSKFNIKIIDKGTILLSSPYNNKGELSIGKKNVGKQDEIKEYINHNEFIELFELIDTLIKKSRLIKRIGLLISKFKNIEEIELKKTPFLQELLKKKSDLTFEVEIYDNFNYERFSSKDFVGNLIENFYEIKVNLEKPDLTFFLYSKKNNYLFLDLTGKDLTKRDYKINVNSLTLNSIIPNYCFYLLNLHQQYLQKENKLKKRDKNDKTKKEEKNQQDRIIILDPIANLGEIIIEASLFNPRKDMKYKNYNSLPYIKLFTFLNRNIKNRDINKEGEIKKDKNKYYAVVQNNKNFKKLKENLNYTGTKINVSLYELDWLDVKFEEDSIDYLITLLPFYKIENKNKEIQNLLFYQTEYILKNKACIITLGKIYKDIIKKYNLTILKKTTIEIGKQIYNIYILENKKQ